MKFVGLSQLYMAVFMQQKLLIIEKKQTFHLFPAIQQIIFKWVKNAIKPHRCWVGSGGFAENDVIWETSVTGPTTGEPPTNGLEEGENVFVIDLSVTLLCGRRTDPSDFLRRNWVNMNSIFPLSCKF